MIIVIYHELNVSLTLTAFAEKTLMESKWGIQISCLPFQELTERLEKIYVSQKKSRLKCHCVVYQFCLFY